MTAVEARLQGLPPVLARHTRCVVLGSFPGEASLAAQQYYGHPRNHFWPLLSAIWQVDLVGLPYPQRLAQVRRRGLGIWDAYASCRREGSLDTAIEAAELDLDGSGADVRDAEEEDAPGVGVGARDLERHARGCEGGRAGDDGGHRAARRRQVRTAVTVRCEARRQRHRVEGDDLVPGAVAGSGDG